MEDSAFIALDVGGTKISGAVFDPSGKILYRHKVMLDATGGNQAGAKVVSMAEELRAKIVQESLKLTAIGVAVPGMVDSQAGTVWAPNIPGWESFPLYQLLRENIPGQVAITIDNDRACYILGEAWKGAAKGCKHAIYLAVGTGIGAGIMINGEVLRGQKDLAGAIGWMALTDSHIPPYTSHGCFEHHASGSGIASLAAREYQSSDDESGSFSTASVFQAYSRQDPVALKVIQNAVIFWGKAVANLVSLFNPEKIVFGGGVFGPASVFLDDIYLEATRWAQPLSIKQVQLVPTTLGNDAGLYGAGYLVKGLNRPHD